MRETLTGQNSESDRSQNTTSSTPSAGRRRDDRIVAASPAIQRALDLATRAARSTSPVLIYGQPGTGRSTLARAIHNWGPVAAGPFEVMNCAAVPGPLQGRELFGCAEKTYPALPQAFAGALERARGGTLLLEAIETLEPAPRAALSAALVSETFRREGSDREIEFSARLIVTAVDRSFETLLGNAALAIELVPLAERREDVLPLATHFLASFAEEAGLAAVGFTPEARSALLQERFPGNVTELRERIRQAVALSGSGAISAEALAVAATPDQVPSFREAKRAFETRYVEALLRRCGGNISQAARLAKKDRKDFYDVIRRTGVRPSEFRR